MKIPLQPRIHMYGLPADIEKILENKNGILLKMLFFFLNQKGLQIHRHFWGYRFISFNRGKNLRL